ncbi:MAG: prephenate dehydrogenase/arogenate dehydrogenase family protein [Candidatus Marsarchaeota archaeon]|jgi:chorismate mutase/prephenate dehydrogenase|nr:prephenate dehydrogenase/arogenate dehydrogenase family protein [Candidatus Marsarchaeota archaeon]MCL5418575.1 prephenate dehydrogenase/arogenate dehydrogenase family protein [Candidatus Marsarchaeota archaeon]
MNNSKPAIDPKVAKELEALRLQIDSVDNSIVRLLAKRMDVVRKVGELKKKHGMEVTDTGREAKVVEKWEGIGHSLNLPPGLAGAVVSSIFPYSKTQEVKSSRKHSVCMVGYGSMSKVLAWAILNAGNSVCITGRDMAKADMLAKSLNCSSAPVEKAVQNAEYIILALSPSAFESGFVEKVLNKARGKLVMDIASAKYPIFAMMQKLSKSLGFSYVSTHPLFGGGSMPVGRKIAIISDSSSGKQGIEEIAGFYSEMGITPVISSLEEHEKAMAAVQVIPHFMTLSLENALSAAETKLGVSTASFSTPNLERALALINGVKSNMNTILEIQHRNKFADAARRMSLHAASSLEKSLRKRQGGR